MEESDILRFDDVQAPGLIDEDDADGDTDTLSVGTTDVGSEEDRQIVQTELSRFRDAQGHSTHTDTIAVEELYHQELEEAKKLFSKKWFSHRTICIFLFFRHLSKFCSLDRGEVLVLVPSALID